MASQSRPISPHLQIYKPQLTSVLSITHRGTGIFLCIGLLALCYWLVALALGPAAYDQAQGVLGSAIGQVLLFVWSFSLFYHLCNGIRHLFWDAGIGLELDAAYTSGKAVVGAAGGLTVITWIAAYAA
jgi:succinate dehydrogenase / fumarate reductase cytochrome b subunit